MATRAQRKTDAEQKKADAFNATHEVGATVYYHNDRGEIIHTTTRTRAEVLSGHTAVIWLDGVRGCVMVDRVSDRAQQS
jgi:hypothetical protein